MKKTITISMFIFWAVVVSIMTAGLVFYQNGKDNNATFSGTPAGQNSPGQNSGVSSLPAGLVLSVAEVAKHNSASDCWMIISGKVYDLTSFLYQHPGGAGTMLPYCGQDGTVGFQTKDIGRPHSQFAVSLLANYYLGDLNQTVSTNSLPPVAQNQTSPHSPTPASRNNEED